MYQVSPEFHDAVLADERQVLARVVIDYTDPMLDQSIEVAADQEANISWPAQTADAVETVPYKWASLDGSWTLDGTYGLAPGTEEEANLYQMGWWGEMLAGAAGEFSSPHPTLTVTFLARPMHSLKVVGDSARGEYPVDFAIRLYSGHTLLHEEIVTGNNQVAWNKSLAASINEVNKMTLEINRWSHQGRQVKITEFFTSVQQQYEGHHLLGLSLLEERQTSQGSLPVGNISANEISLKLSNEDRRFDADNNQSPLYQLLKPNRRVRAWLGAVLPDETVEWVPLGVFWSVEWQASEDTVEATVVARDRLEHLQKSTYHSSHVAENTNLYDLAVAVLEDAGLQDGEYSIDPSLHAVTVPYAWFLPMSHREALRRIAEAALAQVYCDRNGIVRVDGPGSVGQSVLEITADEYFRIRNPMRQTEVANEVIVETQPLRPVDTPDEVYRSNDPVVVPACRSVSVTARYNSSPVLEASASLADAGADLSITAATDFGWGAEVTISNSGGLAQEATLVVEGLPLKVLNRERAVARDDDSIIDQGVLRYEFANSPLVQTLAVAQDIAGELLDSAKDSRRDLEADWRGHPALELGDLLMVKGQTYQVIRQEIDWAGALSATLEGRRQEVRTVILHDSDGNPVLVLGGRLQVDAALPGLITQNGEVRVRETLPITHRLGNQLLGPAGGMSVAADGGTADSWAVDVRYFSRKTALVTVEGTEVSASLRIGPSNTQDAADTYIPNPAIQWTLPVGSHALIIPTGLQADFMWLHFTNNHATENATITGFWNLKEV